MSFGIGSFVATTEQLLSCLPIMRAILIQLRISSSFTLQNLIFAALASYKIISATASNPFH